jgi:biopolymer transport protein ExbB
MRSFILGTILSVAPAAAAQGSASAGQSDGSFAGAAASIQERLEAAIAELTSLREQVALERLPMNKRLNELEAELLAVRQEHQQASRLLDTRTLDLSDLRQKIKDRDEEQAYLSGLFSEYVRNFESRLHIAEIQRYREHLDQARLAGENTSLSKDQFFQAQTRLLSIAVERLEDVAGGTRFPGQAVGPNGAVTLGTFVQVGPLVLFRSDDGHTVGTVEQRLGSLEPTVVALETPADLAAATGAVDGSGAEIPLDPTMGNAHKVAQTKDTLVQHILRGGVVMYPILGLAGTALLVALYKFLQLMLVRRPSAKVLASVLNAVAKQDKPAALAAAKQAPGPVGRMLERGVEHMEEPPELVEEVMYETVLATRLKLQRLLPFVAITSSSAPLLGLLGTVTGIMNTFNLMTVFGTGDVKTLSSGISEALITTEYGLYVAIPSLLLYAYLSRKAKSISDSMEKSALAFANQVRKTPPVSASRAAPQDALPSWPPDPIALRALVSEQVRSILLERAVTLEPASPAHYHRPTPESSRAAEADTRAKSRR